MQLRVLWLDDNPVAFNNADYRKRVIQTCPFLTTLDNRCTPSFLSPLAGRGVGGGGWPCQS